MNSRQFFLPFGLLTLASALALAASASSGESSEAASSTTGFLATDEDRNRTQFLQEVLERFAPDAWVEAFAEIPDDVKHCWVRKSLGLVSSHVALVNPLSRDDNSSTIDSQQNETAEAECPVHENLQKFNETVIASLKALPDNFTDIFKEFNSSIVRIFNGTDFSNMTFDDDSIHELVTFSNAVLKTTEELFQKLHELPQEDRETIANEFPKMNETILAPEMNELFGETTNVVQNLRAIVGTSHALYQKLPPAPNKTGTEEL